METKKQKGFKKGDKLWHPSRGWGIVGYVYENGESIEMTFKDHKACLRRDISLLSFTEYPINANHVRPFEEGDILYYDNNKPHRFITIVGNDNREMLFMDIEKMKIHYFWESHISVGAVHANKVQKQLLFDELAKDGKIWNEETRQLEDMQRPEETEVEKLKRLWYNRNPYGDRFFETALCVFKDMNATAKQLEELNEPKVGDYCIFFDFQEYSAAMVGKLKAIYNNRVYNYRATQGCFENCIKWDGSKEHLDSVRNGIIK